MRSAAVQYFTRYPAVTAACPRAIKVCDFPVPGGPTRARLALLRSHSGLVR
jgi:hypothetical protein